MKKPNIIIKPDKCPYCGEDLKICFNITGPTQYNNKVFKAAHGNIVCEKCKREWTIDLLLNTEGVE